MSMRHYIALIMSLFLSLLIGQVSQAAPPAYEPPLQIVGTLPGRQIILRAEEWVIDFHVPPPKEVELGIQSATFIINWNPANCAGAVSSWPTQAKNAFNYALRVRKNISSRLVV